MYIKKTGKKFPLSMLEMMDAKDFGEDCFRGNTVNILFGKDEEALEMEISFSCEHGYIQAINLYLLSYPENELPYAYIFGTLWPENEEEKAFLTSFINTVPEMPRLFFRNEPVYQDKITGEILLTDDLMFKWSEKSAEERKAWENSFPHWLLEITGEMKQVNAQDEAEA